MLPRQLLRIDLLCLLRRQPACNPDEPSTVFLRFLELSRENVAIQAKNRGEAISNRPGAVNFRDFIGSNKNRVGVNAACKFAQVSIEERAALGIDLQSLLLLFTCALYQVVVLRNLQVNKSNADGEHPEDNKRRND